MAVRYECECGREHELSMWAIAHRTIKILHVCAKCNRHNTLLDGSVVKSKEGKK